MFAKSLSINKFINKNGYFISSFIDDFCISHIGLALQCTVSISIIDNTIILPGKNEKSSIILYRKSGKVDDDVDTNYYYY